MSVSMILIDKCAERVRAGILSSNNSDNYRVPLKPISANDEMGTKKYAVADNKYDNRSVPDKYDNRPAQDKYENRPTQDKYDNKYAPDWSRPSRYADADACFHRIACTASHLVRMCLEYSRG